MRSSNPIRPAEPTYTLRGRNLGETAKAVRFKVESITRDSTKEEMEEDPPRTEWFPFSQIVRTEIAAQESGELDVIVVKEWILSQKSML